MSGTMQKLKDEMTQALALADGLMKKAHAEEREITPEERETVDTHLAKARDAKARLGRLEDSDKISAEIAELIKFGAAPPAPAPRSLMALPGGVATLGRQWVESAAFQFFQEGRHRGGMAWTSPAVELVAATLTTDPASGGAVVPVQQGTSILSLPLQVPRVADLFAQGTTTTGLIAWLVEATEVNAAAAVAEGGLKPESTLTFDAVTKALAKVATWLPVSEEMLADVPQIEAYINARLMLFVAIKMDDQVLNGTGVAPNMLGILATPGLSGPVAAGATELNADAVYRALMTALTASMLMPDGIVLHPANWASSVTAKTTNGDYYGPGMFAALPAPALWGLPVVPTTAIALGTGLVGAFKTGAQFWKRNEITVQASNSHADYFVRNLVAIRAEQRALLTTYRPSAFCKVTGLKSGVAAPALAGAEEAPEGGNGGTKALPAKR
jgi:HK97 family phage major capsid protein